MMKFYGINDLKAKANEIWQDISLLNGEKSAPKVIFLSLLFLWSSSLFFKNAVYQASFALLNLYFFWHVFYFKNFKILQDILKRVRFLALCGIALFIVICVANLLNAQYLSDKTWETTIFLVFRFGTIFFALCYFYKLGYFKRREILIALFIGLLLLAFGGAHQAITNHDAVINVDRGLHGFLHNRNGFGLFMGFGVIFSIVFIRRMDLRLIFAAVFAFFMIFSFSRSSWVACFSASTLFFALNFRQFKKTDLIYVLIFILFLTALYLYFDSFHQRFEKLMAGNSTYRDLIWKYSLGMIADKPILGWGLDTFRDLPNSPAILHHDRNATHNMILEVLLYTGVVGFFLYFSIVANLFKSAFKARDFSVLTALCYFLVVCQFDYGAYMSKEILSIITIFGFLAYEKRLRS